MQILIVSATEQEIKPTVSFLNELNSKTNILITGIGGVATTFSLTDYCSKNSADVIIQAGVAGGFRKNELGEVFAVKEEILADLGVWENKAFKSIFDLKLENKNKYPFKKGLLANPYKKLLALTQAKKARGISINEISTDNKKIEAFKQYFSPVVESMEGGAFHYVCLQYNIPFIQLRATSNQVGERNKSKWKMKEAISSLNKELILLLTELSGYHETDFRI